MNTINKIQINGTTYDINGPATAQEYGLIKLGYTQNNKNYPVLLSEGKAYVYVPWENTQYTLSGLMGSTAKGSTTQPIYWSGSQFVSTTYSLNKTVPADAVFTDTTYGVATANDLGLIKLGYQAEQNSKNYPVTVDANNKAYVNVPWTDTDTIYTLPSATSDALGGIKASQHSGSVSYNTISSTANRYYQVEIDSNDGATKGRAFVNVPWEASAGGGTSSDGFSSIATNTTTSLSASSQPDLHVSSNGGINTYIGQGQGDLLTKLVLYIDVKEATSTQYGGIKIASDQYGGIDLTEHKYPVQLTPGLQNGGYAYVYVPVTDGDDGIGISDITVEYQSGDSGTTAPSDSLAQNDGWTSTVPSVSPGNYLWTRITITTTATNDNTFTAYSVARQGLNGSGGGSSSAMTIETSLSGAAQPNVLYNLGTLSDATSITLGGTLSQNTAAEYLFRFKTGTTSGHVVTFTHPTYTILYPYDYILNLDTEYEVSILWDGSKLLVRNCAYTNS